MNLKFREKSGHFLKPKEWYWDIFTATAYYFTGEYKKQNKEEFVVTYNGKISRATVQSNWIHIQNIETFVKRLKRQVNIIEGLEGQIADQTQKIPNLISSESRTDDPANYIV